MEYLALLAPVVTLAGLPLLDRLERWAAFLPRPGALPGPDGLADAAVEAPAPADAG